jgi:hypothetical protein
MPDALGAKWYYTIWGRMVPYTLMGNGALGFHFAPQGVLRVYGLYGIGIWFIWYWS